MHMAQTTTINLMDQPEFESSSVGRLLTWAITYGRYIMIGTEIIVLLAFISRFSLDRRLTDLREAITQKQMILQANLQFENDFANLQQSLIKIKKLLNGQDKPVTVLYQISSFLPSDVAMTSYSSGKNTIQISLLAGTTDGLSLFLQRMQNSSLFTNIDITDIQKDAIKGIQFELTATTKSTETSKAITAAEKTEGPIQ
jgi:Tfp pilus assembly protein PilN